MNFTQIKVFREIMETGSISQAARNLGRTQPAVSLALKSLEADLGVQLFERRGRRLSPVPEAQYLLSEASDVLDRMAQVERAMQSFQKAGTGQLSVASMPGPAAFLFPRFLSDVMARSPELTVSLLTRSSTQIRELARSQSLDFAFSDYDPDLPSSPQITETVITGHSFLAVRKDHELAAEREVDISALHNRPFFRMQPDSPFDRALSQEFGARGIEPHVTVRSQTLIPVIQFVRSGQGAAIFDPLTVATEKATHASDGSIAYLRLREPIRYRYVILTPRFRPLSILARTIRDEWRTAVINLLTDLQATPEAETLDEQE